MGMGQQIRQQLAAKALKRQLDRVADGVSGVAPGMLDAPAKSSSSTPERLRNVDQMLCRFDTMPGYQQVAIMRQMRERLQLESPFFKVHEGCASATTQIGGKTYTNFANYNYLGFSGDPAVSAAAKAAIDRYGTSASASRMVAGERPVHRELEQALAKLYGVDDCVALVSGHATNVTVVGSLFGASDLIVHDQLAHNSLVQGAQLSGAKRLVFAHNDWQALDELLTRVRHQYQRVLIAIEGLYSMDGDLPDLARFVEIKRRHSAFLMVDEAHSLGVLGATGRGIHEHCGIDAREVDIWMGTLSKTLAGCGGFIAGDQALIDIVRHLAPGFLYSVGLAPALAAAALTSIECMLAEPQRVARLHERGRQFLEEASRLGLNTGRSAGYSVVPVITGSTVKAVRWCNALFEEGINVQPIFYPAVEERLARLRFFICSTHTPEQISATTEALARVSGK
ncbi:aminotransferase class I/II-fold pyridoxal phosphate-dependent enzyme [Paraburkholderia sp. J67]|uniref:aminotransferase class I/II-fold pyridoxal phosphate-dependent enzyme n=1 Tax=Paraburkholderia sp. J67 TaxID=2805435 RepID=UPI002ABDBCE6|nr:aminotransferase class I/II-fold pyridoxal phosphate-dependent enzyme [Paraburkholderia sp. J67]